MQIESCSEKNNFVVAGEAEGTLKMSRAVAAGDHWSGRRWRTGDGWLTETADDGRSRYYNLILGILTTE